MKIIDNENHTVSIFLEDNDILKISALGGNKEHLEIKCLNSTLHVDEMSVSKIKEKAIEEQEIKKMKKYLENEK